MRLFAAVDPPAEAVALLAGLLPRDSRLRYVRQDQWHITVAFYGEVPEAALEELSERLGRVAARTTPFRLSLAAAGTFPARASQARVLWCGLSGELAALSRMADRAVAAGRRSGAGLEDRRFRPHLTLARARREPVDLSSTVAALSGFSGPEWQVDRLRLVRSHLGAVTRHEQLASWPLGAPGAGGPTGPEARVEGRGDEARTAWSE